MSYVAGNMLCTWKKMLPKVAVVLIMSHFQSCIRIRLWTPYCHGLEDPRNETNFENWNQGIDMVGKINLNLSFSIFIENSCPSTFPKYLFIYFNLSYSFRCKNAPVLRLLLIAFNFVRMFFFHHTNSRNISSDIPCTYELSITLTWRLNLY